jgi:protein ImuA
MPASSADLPRNGPETVSDLRRRLGLFSFPHDAPLKESASYRGPLPGWNLRPGSIVEWLAAAPGAGALASALQLGAQPRSARGIVAIVDSTKECYAPALSGWGISPGQILLVRPNSRFEACWAIEQCLRCPGVSATWAWVEPRLSPRVHRRWQLAAEVGGGVGIIFRPETARREPVWADLRLLVTPRPGGRGDTRWVRIDVLYHRGGLGGTAQLWELDHAEGAVRLVPEVGDPAVVGREA